MLPSDGGFVFLMFLCPKKVLLQNIRTIRLIRSLYLERLSDSLTIFFATPVGVKIGALRAKIIIAPKGAKIILIKILVRSTFIILEPKAL